MTSPESNPTLLKWYAVRVKSNQENVTANSLSQSGFETFLPKQNHSPRSNPVAKRPLFPGYVFCRFDVCRRLPILMLSPVVNIVGIGKTPEPIDDEEMLSLQLATYSNLPLTPVSYTTGDKIRIAAGPLSGITGTFERRKNARIIVSVTLLQRSVAVDVPEEWIDSVQSRV